MSKKNVEVCRVFFLRRFILYASQKINPLKDFLDTEYSDFLSPFKVWEFLLLGFHECWVTNISFKKT